MCVFLSGWIQWRCSQKLGPGCTPPKNSHQHCWHVLDPRDLLTVFTSHCCWEVDKQQIPGASKGCQRRFSPQNSIAIQWWKWSKRVCKFAISSFWWIHTIWHQPTSLFEKRQGFINLKYILSLVDSYYIISYITSPYKSVWKKDTVFFTYIYIIYIYITPRQVFNKMPFLLWHGTHQDICEKVASRPSKLKLVFVGQVSCYVYIYIPWMWPPPSNSGKLRFIGIPY